MHLKLLRKSARSELISGPSALSKGPRSSMYAPPGKTRPCPLTAGAVADVVGSRPLFLTGCVFLACFVLACGLARTAIELIMFRAMQGIAVVLCLPPPLGGNTHQCPSQRRDTQCWFRVYGSRATAWVLLTTPAGRCSCRYHWLESCVR